MKSLYHILSIIKMPGQILKAAKMYLYSAILCIWLEERIKKAFEGMDESSNLIYKGSFFLNYDSISTEKKKT